MRVRSLRHSSHSARPGVTQKRLACLLGNHRSVGSELIGRAEFHPLPLLQNSDVKDDRWSATSPKKIIYIIEQAQQNLACSPKNWMNRSVAYKKRNKRAYLATKAKV